MNILRMLLDKSWLHPTAAVTVAQYGGPDAQAAARVMLRFILAIVGVIFFLFIITFLSRSQYPDFEALAGPPWQPFTAGLRQSRHTMGSGGGTLWQAQRDSDGCQRRGVFYRVLPGSAIGPLVAPTIHGLLHER
jgi:hypothetical protein